MEYDSFEAAANSIREFEIETDSQFVVCRSTSNFNKCFVPSLEELRSSRIRYSGNGIVTGPVENALPFLYIGSCDFACIHGRGRLSKSSANYQIQTDHDYHTKKRRRTYKQPSKKLNCPFSIKLQEVICFEGLQARTKKRRVTISKLLKNSDSFPAFKRLFIVSRKGDHENHLVGKISGVNKSTSKDIIQKIHQLVSSGEVHVSRIKKELTQYVENMPVAKKPSILNRQYYPSNKTIYNHVQTALANSRYSNDEQLNVKNYLQKLSKTYPGMKYYYREHSDIHNNKFLLVLQMEWQAELLKKFNNTLLIDSTFNTSKYKLPLYEIVTLTNVGYSPVCIFITEDELESSITDGLKSFKSLLSSKEDWSPSSFVTDCDVAQSNAIHAVFPDSARYLCKFHVEQAWKRWLSRRDNGLLDEMDDALHLLRRLAASVTPRDFEDNLDDLRSRKLWQDNPHLQNYLKNTWLNSAQRWVRAYRPLTENIVVTTTNGVEVHHRILKSLLGEYGCRTAKSLIEVIVTKYFSQSLESYIERNVQAKSTSKLYSDAVPKFIQGKPKVFVEHCMARIPDAVLYSMDEVMKVDAYNYSIISLSDPNRTYHLALNVPSCDCSDFQLHYMPCKHFLSVIILYNAWKDVPSSYTSSKYYTINEDFLMWVNATMTGSCVHQESEPGSVQICEASSGKDEEIVTFSSVPSTQQYGLSRDLAKANIAINTIRNYVHNTSNAAAVNDASEMLIQCYKTLLQRYGHVSAFKRSANVKHRQLKVPKSFLKRRKLSKRIQKQTHYFKERNSKLKVKHKTLHGPKARKAKQFKSQPNENVEILEDRNLTQPHSCERLAVTPKQSSTVPEIDMNAAFQLVLRLWSLPKDFNIPVAKVHGQTVTDTDIRSLKNGEWLTDKAIDSYLAHLVTAQNDIGRKIVHLVQSTMTGIINRTFTAGTMKRSFSGLNEAEMVIGVYHRSGHWTLLVVEVQTGLVYFYNPSSEQAIEMKRIEASWTNFIVDYSNKFHEAFPKPFTVTRRQHAIQRDANNCGVYCLMFAENHLNGESMIDMSEANLQQMRKKVAQKLMLYEVFLTDCCPKCGYHVADEDEKMQCNSCGRYYHFKSYCIEDDLAELSLIGESSVYVCRLCRINFWPESALIRKKNVAEDRGANTLPFSSTSEMIRKLHRRERPSDDGDDDVSVKEVEHTEQVIPSKCEAIQVDKTLMTFMQTVEPLKVVPSSVSKSASHNLRRGKMKEKRQSFVYPKLKKNTRRFCVCKKKNDGGTYWQCEVCEEWYHPQCIGYDVNLEPESFICCDCKPSIDFREGDKEYFADGGRKRVQSVIEDLYEMMECGDKKCMLEDHQRHHAFVCRPLEVIREEKKKFGFGMKDYSSKHTEDILEMLTETLLVSKFKDPNHPYQGRFTSICNLNESSELQKTLRKYDIADKYIIFILLKEVQIHLHMKKTKQPYHLSERMLQSAEFCV